MATAKPDTGHGATLTFGTTSGTFKLRGIPTNLKSSLPVVNISHMGTTTDQEVMPGDLVEHDEVECEILFEAVAGLPAPGTVETITITFPLQATGASVAASIAGTGFLTSRTFPPLQSNTEMVGRITFKFNGDTGPAFTAASGA